MTGILLGLGLAWYLFSKGFIPQPEQAEPVAGQDSPATQAADQEEVAPATDEPRKSQYDFFTVLPEMEVVVPEHELAKKRAQQATQPAVAGQDTENAYLLQVGSFREKSDAEERKAQMALLGVVASVQTVNVDGVTWHRVRVGPVNGARQADEMRSRLAQNGIESLVMKSP